MKDVDDKIADEDLDEDDVDEDDDAEPTATDLEDPNLPADPASDDDVESIQDLLTKQEAGEAEEAEEEAAPPPTPAPRGETAEAADNRVVPMQSSEFQCTNCFLVKHRSQLADPKKMRCRDCA